MINFSIIIDNTTYTTYIEDSWLEDIDEYELRQQEILESYEDVYSQYIEYIYKISKEDVSKDTL